MNESDKINAQVTIGELMKCTLDEEQKKLELFSIRQLLNMLEELMLHMQKSELPLKHRKSSKLIGILTNVSMRLGNLEKNPAPLPEKPYNYDCTPEDYASTIEHIIEVANRRKENSN